MQVKVMNPNYTVEVHMISGEVEVVSINPTSVINREGALAAAIKQLVAQGKEVRTACFACT